MTTPSKTPGATTTYSAKKDSPVEDDEARKPHINTPLDADEVKGMVGELKPGELGWVKLNDEGEPEGAATRDPPTDGPAARVYATAPVIPLELTTPSGAPITEHMNPAAGPPFLDAGLRERNPTDGTTKHPSNSERTGPDGKPIEHGFAKAQAETKTPPQK